MARIDIQQPHQLPAEQAREAVDQVALKLAERFGLQTHWQDDTLHFNGSGVDGTIGLEAGLLHLQAALGFPLSMMHGAIEAQVRHVLEQRFGNG